MNFPLLPQRHASAVRGIQQHVRYAERPSDSSVVERIWHTQTETDDECIAIADGRWDIMFFSFEGETRVMITGPQTNTILIPHRAGSEWLGIRFRVGVTIPEIPLPSLVNEGVELPPTRRQFFSLKGTSWQQPTYENADTFIDHLMSEQTFAIETSVMSIMRGEQPHWSTRTMQERFRRTTGLTFKTIEQIERAQMALVLLQQGVSIGVLDKISSDTGDLTDDFFCCFIGTS
ncbi:MAG: hypothetical protein SF029_17525 [bacterium]|nr:hypothetical protein [bacterium]